MTRLGISPIGWTNNAMLDLGDHIPFQQCIEEAAAAGFVGMELGRKFPADPEACRGALAAVGMVPVTGWHSGELTHRDVDAEWAALEPFAQHLLALGCEVLVYGECGHGPAEGSAACLAQAVPYHVTADYARRLDDLATRLAGQGLTLAYHPHMMHAVDTDERIDRLMSLTGPAVRLLLDTGHIAMSGGDWVAVAERWWGRIGHIHLKDVHRSVLDSLDPLVHSFDDAVRMGLFTVPGEGDLNFAPLARLIARRGYAGWCIVEAERDPETIPPAKLAQRAQAHLRDLFTAARVRLHSPNPALQIAEVQP